MNKAVLADDTLDRFASSVFNTLHPDRFRGDLQNNQAVWGFVETSIDTTSRIANAVALTGDILTLYIAPQGHGVGWLPGVSGEIFCSSQLEITLFDCLRGTSATHVFTGFSAAPDANSRYLEIHLPESDANGVSFESLQGVRGLYTLLVQETCTPYQRADMSCPILVGEEEVVYHNSSWLQIQTVYWKDVLNDVTLSPTTNRQVLNNCDFITNRPLGADVEPTSAVFDDHTIFPTYAIAPLTDRQKDIVLRDSVLGLLGSQAPLLTADHHKAPTIGIGLTDAAANPEGVHTPEARVASRLFGLHGSPPAINTLDALSSITNDHGQLSIQLRDPLRIISHAEDGVATMRHSPAIAVATGVDAIRPTPHTTRIAIGQPTILVNNVAIQPHTTSEQTVGAWLSFNVTSGEEAIQSVSFGFAVDDEDYFTLEDSTGEVRNQYVRFASIDKTATATSTLYGLVGVRTKDGQGFFYRCLHCLALDNNQPSMVRIFGEQQRASNRISVSYDYLSRREIAPATVALSTYLRDQPAMVAGDVGAGVLPGSRNIRFASNGTQPLQASLTLTANGVGAVGETNSGYIRQYSNAAIALSAVASATRYGLYDGYDPKNQDLTPEEEAEINTSSSVDSTQSSSSILASSHSTSSSRSSIGYSTSSTRSTISNSSQDCAACHWTLKCVTPNGVVGTPYSGRVCIIPTFDPACTGMAWLCSITQGYLPPGLSMDLNGEITGIPTVGGRYCFTTTVTESRCGDVQTIECCIVVPHTIIGDYNMFGDPHFYFVGDANRNIFVKGKQLDFKLSPFAFDDNVEPGSTVYWFGTKLESGDEDSIHYTTVAFPAVEGGVSISRVIVNSSGVVTTFDTDGGLTINGQVWDGEEVAIDLNLVQLTVTGREIAPNDCNGLNSTFRDLAIKCSIESSWNRPGIARIGGLLYHAMKAAANKEGVVNIGSSPNFDGASRLLSDTDLNRNSFTGSNPQWENWNADTANSLWAKHVELCGLRGRVNAGWDISIDLETPEVSVSISNGDTANLSWAAITGADGYELEYKVGDGEWQALEETTATATTHTGLTCDTDYQWRVRATRESGCPSDWGETDVQHVTGLIPACDQGVAPGGAMEQVGFIANPTHWVVAIGEPVCNTDCTWVDSGWGYGSWWQWMGVSLPKFVQLNQLQPDWPEWQATGVGSWSKGEWFNETGCDGEPDYPTSGTFDIRIGRHHHLVQGSRWYFVIHATGNPYNVFASGYTDSGDCLGAVCVSFGPMAGGAFILGGAYACPCGSAGGGEWTCDEP